MFGVAVDTRIHPQAGMARILVVEAEPLVAILLESALCDFGYHVLGPVETLKAATYFAATEHIDAAVVDTNIDWQIAKAVADKLIERGIPVCFHQWPYPHVQSALQCDPAATKTIHDRRPATHNHATRFIPLATQRTKVRSSFCRLDATSGDERNAGV